MPLVHHHLIFQSSVARDFTGEPAEEILQQFLLDLVKELDMHVLIPPQLMLSEHKAWTGLVGIVTSHIAFHFWTIEKYLQLDIYSCKVFDKEKVIRFIHEFWRTSEEKILFIDREMGKDFIYDQLT